MSGIKSTGSDITDLLLLLCRDELTAEERAYADVLGGRVTDWGLFADLALRNGVAALAWYNLSQCSCAAEVPQRVSTFLEGAMQKTIARVGFISDRAAAINTVLERAGVSVILLKGLALEHTVYGMKGLRQMSDVDILVRPEQAVAAWELLKRDGYRHRPAKSVFHKKIMMHLGNHLPELHRDGISVDIHHRLFHNEGSDLIRASFTDNPVVTVAGVKCHILPPRVAFLSMVRHLSKHDIKGEFQIRLFADLYLMIKFFRDEIFCKELLDDAVEVKVLKESEKVLYVLSCFWPCHVPEYLTAGLTAQQKEEYCRWFTEGVSAAGAPSQEKDVNVYGNVVSGIDTLHHRLLFLLGDIFPSVAFMKKRYRLKSTAAAIMRYPLRLGKLFWFVRALLHRH